MSGIEFDVQTSPSDPDTYQEAFEIGVNQQKSYITSNIERLIPIKLAEGLLININFFMLTNTKLMAFTSAFMCLRDLSNQKTKIFFHLNFRFHRSKMNIFT